MAITRCRPSPASFWRRSLARAWGSFAEGETLGQLALGLVKRYPDAFTESQVKVRLRRHRQSLSLAHPLRSGDACCTRPGAAGKSRGT